MFIFVWYILLLSSLDVINATRERKRLAGDPHTDYNGIVLNMIKSWESPVVYLRGRGFLPSDYEDTSKIKPSLDALMERLQRNQRESESKLLEETQSQKIDDGPTVTKHKRSLAWEQLQVLINKLVGPKSKPDERDETLLELKHRLEKLELEASEKELSAQNYDEILQRMIEKTSPYSGKQPLSVNAPKAPPSPTPNPNSLRAYKDVPVTSAPLSLSTYGPSSPLLNLIDKSGIHVPKSSRLETPVGKSIEAAPKLRAGLAAPTFLSWDMKNGRLDHYSRKEKETYLNKVLGTYGHKLDSGLPGT